MSMALKALRALRVYVAEYDGAYSTCIFIPRLSASQERQGQLKLLTVINAIMHVHHHHDNISSFICLNNRGS